MNRFNYSIFRWSEGRKGLVFVLTDKIYCALLNFCKIQCIQKKWFFCVCEKYIKNDKFFVFNGVEKRNRSDKNALIVLNAYAGYVNYDKNMLRQDKKKCLILNGRSKTNECMRF